MKWIFCLLACIFSNHLAFAQNLGQVFALGNQAYEVGNYPACISFMSRVCFFDENDIYKKEAYKLMAYSYIEENMPSEACRYLDLAAILSNESDEKTNFLLEKSKILLLNEEYHAALQELLGLAPTENDSITKKKAFYTFTAYYGLGQFKKSKEVLYECLKQPVDSQYVNEAFQVIDKKLNPKRAKRAKLASIILPGSGQIAAGNLKNAVNTITLVGAIIYLYVNTISNYGLISGIISVYPWLNRYYIGGSENAFRSMIERQQILKNRYYNRLLLQVDELCL